ncbi:ATP-binding protein [Ornithinimicrobium sp. F0845]|uniref:ATP-binding protein n=1 Tax=Ornithinimicrobium sp. F0845 TaxID=2926412 RepID=UPI001FF39BC0|nr:ATP-binding protein [Ornithinimicrobium sp. F0845]MCK0110681.1 ATP-binding protein [Ornithinimicrobium sp. F0845]
MVNLPIGTRLDLSQEGPELVASQDPAELDASRFNRHTFWCGQSGSGKTYALGVVLEQLLLRTELPLLVLDPNADFSRISEPHPAADPDAGTALGGKDLRVLHTSRPDGPRLHARFKDLSTVAKAAVLRLDPIADAEEYNVLLHVDSDPEHFRDADFVASLRASGNPGQARLATRIENLQVLEWGLWARGAQAATDVVDERPRATVLDLGGFAHPAELKVAALSVLEHLWATRESRRPVLIVIDEAHNICPPTPVTPVEQLLTDQVIQIAAEGRKFGLWLFLSTQRPTKIHPNVLSQCDNLGLMRMNAPRDLAELADVFGFVPEDALRRSASFRQGQALFAGGFVTHPMLVQMGARITQEGGSDVRVPLG